MKRLSKKNIIQHLEIIFKKANFPSHNLDFKMPSWKVISSHGVSLYLKDEAFDSYNLAVDAILEDEYLSDMLSRNCIQNKLNEFITSNWKEYKAGDLDIQVKLDEKIAALRDLVEKYTVIIPIGGIKFDRSRGLKIGNVVIKLCRRNDLKFKHIRKFPEYKSYLEGLTGQVVGIIEVEGEPTKAKEKALNEVHRVLNILRFYVRVFHLRSNEIQIRIAPEIMIGTKILPLVDSHRNRIFYTGVKPAGTRLFKINNPNIKNMRSLSFNIINQLLNKKVQELSKFEKEILLAIKWYGNAVDMTDPVLKFLNYAIVLEVLLSKHETDSDRTITDKLSEGVAFLLKKKYQDRANIKRDVKKLYRIRNSIVHGGKDFVGDRNINLIEYIGFVLILELLKKTTKFRTKDNLLNWIEEKRLS